MGKRCGFGLRSALINQVLDQVLGEQEQEFDAETRWAIQWFSQFFFDEGPYGAAEQLAVSMNVSVGGMVESGILESVVGRCGCCSRDEYPDDWDPATDVRTPVWEATQHLVKRLEDEGEASAARLLAPAGWPRGLGPVARVSALHGLRTNAARTSPARTTLSWHRGLRSNGWLEKRASRSPSSNSRASTLIVTTDDHDPGGN